MKRTSIERGLVRMVVTPAKEISVQALFRIRTAHDRLAVQLPAKGKIDAADPLRINGSSVILEIQDKQKGDYSIPIVAPNADTPFLLELRYIIPESDGSQLDLPVFPQDSAAQKVYMAVYLPEKKTLLNAEGPWTKEFYWEMIAPAMMWHPRPNSDVGSLVNWVREGINISGNSADDFPTDGTLYLYSTLRPEGSPKGTMAMTAMNARWLQALVFLAVFLGGAMLIPAGCSAKSLAAGALIATVILLGVFYPVFAMQTLNGIFVLAVFLVLVLWSVAWVFHLQRRRPAAAAAGTSDASSRDSGVDLTRYEPHRAETPHPQSPAAAEPPKPAGGDGAEGGQSHE